MQLGWRGRVELHAGRSQRLIEARIGVRDCSQVLKMRYVAQLLKAPDFMGGIESAVVLAEELLTPLRRQQAEDLTRIVRRALHRLSSHAHQITQMMLSLDEIIHSPPTNQSRNESAGRLGYRGCSDAGRSV